MTGNGAHRKRDSVDSGQSTVRLTRTLSQEIRDLKTREAQYERAYSPPHSSSTSSSLRHSSASLGAIIHGSYGDVSELGHDDSVLEDSQHGNGAALSAIQREERKQKERLRLMVVDMLFSAARGRLSSCKKKMAAVEAMGLLVTDPGCCDYDKRTPLHLAAAAGSFKVTEWLLREKRANPNSIDRFGSTPLQGAIWGDHKMIVSLLVENGAKLQENGNLVDYKPLHAIGSFCDLTKLQRRLSGSGHSGLGLADPQNGANLLCLEDEFWEISEDAVTREEKLGEGEFGTVYKALWGETPVAVKVLKHR